MVTIHVWLSHVIVRLSIGQGKWGVKTHWSYTKGYLSPHRNKLPAVAWRMACMACLYNILIYVYYELQNQTFVYSLVRGDKEGEHTALELYWHYLESRNLHTLCHLLYCLHMYICTFGAKDSSTKHKVLFYFFWNWITCCETIDLNFTKYGHISSTLV